MSVRKVHWDFWGMWQKITLSDPTTQSYLLSFFFFFFILKQLASVGFEINPLFVDLCRFFFFIWSYTTLYYYCYCDGWQYYVRALSEVFRRELWDQRTFNTFFLVLLCSDQIGVLVEIVVRKKLLLHYLPLSLYIKIKCRKTFCR